MPGELVCTGKEGWGAHAASGSDDFFLQRIASLNPELESEADQSMVRIRFEMVMGSVLVTKNVSMLGGEVSITTEPFVENTDSLPTASTALTLKNQVPWAKSVEWVKLSVRELEKVTPVRNEESNDHSTVYEVGLPVDAAHVQVGVVLLVGVTVGVGAPGCPGATVSTTTLSMVLTAIPQGVIFSSHSLSTWSFT